MAILGRDQLETEVIPGTEILLRGDNLSYMGYSEKLVMVPEPTDDPEDPLNWSQTWKTIVIINQAVFVFVSVLTPLSIAPLTGIFIQEFHKTLPQVNMLFGAAAIALGYANFIIVPFSNLFGRRPTILICGLVCILANIWQARVASYPSFLGARVVSGLGAAANESIMPMVVADVMFLHQRGLWMGVYFWSYFLGLFIGPIISGNIAAHVSWRWFFWVCTIAQFVNLLMIIFMFPETRYRRISKPNTLSERSSSIDNTITRDTKANEAHVLTQTTTRPESEKSTTLESSPVRSQRGSIDDVRISPNQYLHMGRPSKAQFSLIPKVQYEGSLTILRDVVAPIQIFTYPIILWAAMSLGFAANCLLALNLTQAQVFEAPPYLFSPAQVGFVNFAFVVGGIIGLLTAGPISDWVSMRATIRNNGVREAEMRLVALIPYLAICLVGMTISAVGYQRHWHWEAIVIIGYGFVGIEVVSIPAIVISYAVDCYKHIPGQIMVTATIVKNTFGFGMIFFFNDWAVRSGFIPPVMTLMALAVGFSTIGMCVFLRWGKYFRRQTMNSKLHHL